MTWGTEKQQVGIIPLLSLSEAWGDPPASHEGSITWIKDETRRVALNFMAMCHSTMKMVRVKQDLLYLMTCYKLGMPVIHSLPIQMYRYVSAASQLLVYKECCFFTYKVQQPSIYFTQKLLTSLQSVGKTVYLQAHTKGTQTSFYLHCWRVSFRNKLHRIYHL